MTATTNLIINDLTSAASAYTFNRFIDGEALSEASRPLRLDDLPNLVNPDGSIADFASNNVATAERLNLLANINAAAMTSHFDRTRRAHILKRRRQQSNQS